MQVSHLSAVYERYGYLVHRRCAAILGAQADADDALQEVFMRAQRYPPPSDPDAMLRWLYTIAARCCFDLYRARARAEPSDEQALDVRAVGAAGDADRRAVVGAVLRTAGPTTREIALLAHLDGYTQEEVAEKTGYSRKTVGKKLRAFDERARRLLGRGEP